MIPVELIQQNSSKNEARHPNCILEGVGDCPITVTPTTAMGANASVTACKLWQGALPYLCGASSDLN